MAAHINDEMLNKMDAYWRAANYLVSRLSFTCSTTRCLREPLTPRAHQEEDRRPLGDGARTEP